MKPIYAFLVFAAVAVSAAQSVDPKFYSGMQWRNIGPYRGGRCIAVTGSTQRPKEYFFGATGGGVWKTTDGGTSWAPVSDGFFTTATVGAVAVAPSNPDIVYAGTGERDIRGDISHGDGVYRSDDAGKTWRNIGLKDSQTISRIVVHPSDPNTAYVAVLGHVYGSHPTRGVYKTTDGGKSWQQVLAGAEKTGVVDLCLDPQHPSTLLATLWEAWRTPYTLNSGGPNSSLMKTTDGGKTWTDLSRAKGMPTGTLGKIGVSISPVDSKRYWALVEALDGGLFRSDDEGATWTKVNESRNWRQRAWYYTHVYADTKNKDTVYILNVGVGKSTDGGKTFSGVGTPHSDNHDLWIAPEDPARMIEGNDGGANVSTDGGRTWSAQTFPTGQFYHVVTDNAFPYRVLGAQQDNSTVRILSRSERGSITSEDWTDTAGGESGYIAVKPNDPDIVYGGSYGGDLSMRNHRTNQYRPVDPWPDNPMGHGAIDLVHRFQWTYPIVFSPHDPNMLYTCSQYVLMTTNGGQSWKKISPDLTRNDPSTLGSSGGPITKDNTSVEYYGTVFTFAESPRRKGVLWAGSDDGLVHVSQDGGRNWKDVTPKGMPKWGLVSMIDPSAFDAGTAFVAVDNHENDDLAPYAYKTTDYGATWTKIVTGLPSDGYVRVVREDHKQKGLLYAGTETGIWVSFDDGGHWQTLQMNLPVCPIHDLVWKDDDLVVATHGRGFWILDDVTPLQQMAYRSETGGVRFFPPKDAYNVRWGGGGRRRGTRGSTEPAGENPLSGVVLSYYLEKDVENVTFEISDLTGHVLASLKNAPHEKGFNRVSTFFQYPSFRGFPGMILWSGFASPIDAPPGEYVATMVMGNVRLSEKFHWLKDPRLPSSDADLVERFKFQQQIVSRLNEANDSVVKIRGVRTGLDKALTSDKVGGALKAQIESLRAGITKVEEAIYQTKNQSGQDPLNYPIRLNDKLAGVFSNVSGGAYKPTDQSREVFASLSKELGVQTSALFILFDRDLKAVNAELVKLGLEEVKIPTINTTATPAFEPQDDDDDGGGYDPDRRRRGTGGGG